MADIPVDYCVLYLHKGTAVTSVTNWIGSSRNRKQNMGEIFSKHLANLWKSLNGYCFLLLELKWKIIHTVTNYIYLALIQRLGHNYRLLP